MNVAQVKNQILDAENQHLRQYAKTMADNRDHYYRLAFPDGEPDERFDPFRNGLKLRNLTSRERPVKYGCHCDLESMNDGFEPDGCVMDAGEYNLCIYASEDGKKENCEYWRPVMSGAENSKTTQDKS